MITPAEVARSALARGDLIAAYDVAQAAVETGPRDSDLTYLQVLALARMGDTDQAAERFAAYGLDRSLDPEHAALGARLLKDRALAAPADQRHALLRAASEAYRKIYDADGGYFPAINAASLAFLGGHRSEAKRLASEVLSHPEIREPNSYFAAATRAEALILLGNADRADEALQRAIGFPDSDAGARSSSYRQLDLVIGESGIAEEEGGALLSLLRPPAVLTFTGHMFALDRTAEARISSQVARLIDKHPIGFAYGALACGADILIAEEVLAHGGELNVVLPFLRDDFIEHSVRPGGDPWVDRFTACLAAARSVCFATETGFVGDPEQLAYGSRFAMGLARLRARHLGAEALQIAVWDGNAGTGPAGTARDVQHWREAGGETVVIDPGDIDREVRRPDAEFSRSDSRREQRAFIFTDFPGFASLSEAALPVFWNELMLRIADVVERHHHHVCARNTWGDALYLVVETPSAAAEIALQIQDAVAASETRMPELKRISKMRVGVHYGPVYRGRDHVTGQMTYYGTEVSRTARIEPVTPPGAVYVSEPFAALLMMEAPEEYVASYVGRLALAKNYGVQPMYRLGRAG